MFLCLGINGRRSSDQRTLIRFVAKVRNFGLLPISARTVWLTQLGYIVRAIFLYMNNPINDINLLKMLAKQAEELAQPHMTQNPHWVSAYKQLARGSALLWRLLEQSGPNNKPETVEK